MLHCWRGDGLPPRSIPIGYAKTKREETTVRITPRSLRRIGAGLWLIVASALLNAQAEDTGSMLDQILVERIAIPRTRLAISIAILRRRCCSSGWDPT
jgi:hypothetical protein